MRLVMATLLPESSVIR